MSLAKEFQDVMNDLMDEFDERKGDKRMMLVSPASDGYWSNEYARWIDGGVPIETPLTGVSVSHEKSVFSNTLIGVNDKIIAITNGVKPDKSDKVKIDGSTLSIEGIKPYNHTGDDLNIGFSVHLKG